MSSQTGYAIELMSRTSVDGINAALVAIECWRYGHMSVMPTAGEMAGMVSIDPGAGNIVLDGARQLLNQGRERVDQDGAWAGHCPIIMTVSTLIEVAPFTRDPLL